MDMVLHHSVVVLVVFLVSSAVLIFDDVSFLKSFLFVLPADIQSAECLVYAALWVQNYTLSTPVRRRQYLLHPFSFSLLLCLFPHPLCLF